jgi:hypothetical protein
MDTPMVFSYVDGGYTIANQVCVNPAFSVTAEFDRILIPPGQSQPLCMFDTKWRAERDAQDNYGRIHYQQLAVWLKQHEELTQSR